MINFEIVGLIVSFCATLLVGTFGLSKFILKLSEKDMREVLEKYNKNVITNNFNILREMKKPTQNDLKSFFSEYRRMVELQNAMEEAEKIGRRTYMLFIATTLLFIGDRIFPEFRFLGVTFLSLGVVVGVFSFLDFINYFTSLVEIRRMIIGIEKLTQERELIT